MTRRASSMMGGNVSAVRHVPRSRFRLRKVAALTMAVGALSLSAATVGASTKPHTKSSAAAKSSGAVKPDLSFFAGKTITYIVSNSVGSGAGIAAVSEVPFLEQYLHATVNLEYISAGTSIVGQNTIADAPADGLTIGDFSTLVDLNQIYLGTDLLQFSLQKVPLIAGTYSGPDYEVTCVGSPFSNFNQVIHSTSPVTVAEVATGAANEFQRVLFGAYHIPTTYITGYSSAATQVAGCLRGDGQLSPGPTADWVNSTGTAFQPMFKPLIMTGLLPKQSPYHYLNKVTPTIATFAKAHPPKTRTGRRAIDMLTQQFAATSPNYVIFAPEGTPKNRVAALEAAFKFAQNQPAAKAGFITAGLPPGFYPPEGLVKYFKQQLTYTSLVHQYLTQ